MNIPFNENMKRVNDQQQSAEQTILLDAIRNKFANNENYSGSPPVFSIPCLKFPEFSPTSISLDSKKETPPSKLNQFVLDKFGESKFQTDDSVGSFSIPDLKIQNDFDCRSLTLTEKLRLNNKNPSETKVNSLNKDIDNLHLYEEQKTNVIDLTTALNQTKPIPAPTTTKQVTITPNPIDFQIPFIDCDLKDKTLNLPLRDEHCLADVSDYVHSRFICVPSRFGKITCLKYRLSKVSRYIDHSFKKKNKIIQFGFDTKSPDDIILTNLRKHNRV